MSKLHNFYKYIVNYSIAHSSICLKNYSNYLEDNICTDHMEHPKLKYLYFHLSNTF